MMLATTSANLLEQVPISLDSFIQRIGVTDTTAWRWRKKGWLKTENILGRVYITAPALREFNRRLEAGDFAKEHIAPKRTSAAGMDDGDAIARRN
jgi:hypothetical protein